MTELTTFNVFFISRKNVKTYCWKCITIYRFKRILFLYPNKREEIKKEKKKKEFFSKENLVILREGFDFNLSLVQCSTCTASIRGFS